VEDLFRFVALRAPQSVDDAPTVALTQKSAFQTTLTALRTPSLGNSDSPASAVPPAQAMAAEALRFQTGAEPYPGRFVSDPAAMLTLHGQLERLRADLLALSSEIHLADLLSRIEKIFAVTAEGLTSFVNGELVRDHVSRVIDSVIAIFLAPTLFPTLLRPLTELAQTLALVQRAGARDARLSSLASVHAVLDASLLLPPAIFPIYPDQIQPLGVGNLLVVKQQLKGYELGDVSTIENVLRGETRRRTDKHTLTRDVTQVDTTETTSETTNELTTTTRFELKQESENTLKEDLSVKAGVSVSAKYGAVQIDAKTDVAYSNAKSDSNKISQTQAKDVTQRAASKVTDHVLRQLTTRIIEALEQTDERTLDNAKGADNLSGIYQFVNKVYEAQVFSYGKRLMFDIMIPEPAAFLLDTATTHDARQAPVKPDAFTLAPHQIDWINPDASNGYGALAAKYGAAITAPPDPSQISLQHSYSDKADSDEVNNNLAAHENIEIPDSYLAVSCSVAAAYNNKAQEAHSMGVIVGSNSFGWNKDEANAGMVRTGTLAAARLVGVAIHTTNVKDYNVTVSVSCVLRTGVVETWRQQTFNAILQAFQERLKDYEDKLAAQTIQPRYGAVLGSGNPDKNREIERNELKKGAIALLGRVDLLAFGAIDTTPPPPLTQEFPRPASVAVVQEQARVIRFFEQAFEWDQITYVFYPYYWGRKETWYDRVQQDSDDPTFGQFLRAGSARVVVPVRLGFEADLRYFLLTGQLWRGADLPHLTDRNYLAITEEIKELSGAPATAKSLEPPWDVKLPTDLVKLRPDGKLPKWQRVSPDGWVWQAVPKDDA